MLVGRGSGFLPKVCFAGIVIFIIAVYSLNYNNPEVIDDIRLPTKVANDVKDVVFFKGEAARLKSNKKEFVKDLLAHDIDGPFDPEPLRQLCANTTWQEGLIFSCGAGVGGVGNVRSIFANCIRFAIEAGGMSFKSARNIDSLIRLRSDRLCHSANPSPRAK